MRLKNRALFVFALLSVYGCAQDSYSPEDGVHVADPIQAGLVDSTWIGRELGARLPDFYDMGEVAIADEEASDTPEVPTMQVGRLREEPARAEGALWEMVDFTTRHRYLMRLSPDIDRVSKFVSDRIAAREAVEEMLNPEGLDQKSVTGDDNRRRLGVADGYAINANWFQTIGRTTKGCTGTVVAPNIMLTAAHCVFNQGAPANYTFYPRRDGTAANGTPYGAWTSQNVFYPVEYTQANCHVNYDTVSCSKFDIALVRVTKPANVVFSWEMAYAYEQRQTLDTRELRTFGYPGCASNQHPNPCTNYTLYGDVNRCRLGINQEAVINGTRYQVATQHGCDTSPGHSGSPVFYYRTNQRPMVIGVNVSHEDARVANNVSTPNWFRRITPDIVNWINANRAR